MSDAKSIIDDTIKNIYECVDNLRKSFKTSISENPNKVVNHFYWRGKLYVYKDVLARYSSDKVEMMDRLIGDEIKYMDDIMNDTHIAIMNVYNSISNNNSGAECESKEE